MVGKQIGAITMDNSMEHFKKVKIKLPYGPAIPHPNIYPKKMKTLTGKDIREALFTIAKIWKQLSINR